MAEVRIKDMDEHEIDTILAEDIDFEGHLTFKKPLMIKGKFKGEIKSTSALYIGEKAYVEATTEAAVVSSKGMHKGNIVGHSRVELFSTAEVEGDVTTPDFVMESGCKFNGYCNMGGGQPAARPAVGAAAAPAAPQAPAAAGPQAASQPSAPLTQPAAHPQAHQHGPQGQQPPGPQGHPPGPQGQQPGQPSQQNSSQGQGRPGGQLK
jgi:cytoskeletal protein CcmA (bactofilin family)